MLFRSTGKQLTFDRMKEMKDKGYIQDTFLSDSYADAQEALLTGTAAMYSQATWIYAELTKLAESQEELENIGFFPIPATEAKDSIAYTETPTGFVVPKEGKSGTDRQEGAGGPGDLFGKRPGPWNFRGSGRVSDSASRENYW